ncbi:MAG: hypothetical protein IKD18_00350, partial [Clostridia bacterium]|nr:hypothetical protein [Clostridia bacterium]
MDRKVLQLESAESKLALAVDSGNAKDEEFFRDRVNRLSKSLNRIQKDLTEKEESKELKGIVQREKAATRKQAKLEAKEELYSYKNDQERKNRIGRIQAKTKLLAERILKNNKEHHVPDYLKKPISDFITALDFSSERKLKGGEETLVGKRYTDLLSDVRSALQGKTEGAKDRLELDLDPYIFEQMEELEKQIREFLVEENRFVLNKMRSEQLKDLDFILTGIIRALNNLDRSFGSAGYHRVSELAGSSIASMQEMKKKTTSEDGWIKKLLSWNSFTPYTAFSRFGEGGKAIYNSILNGWGEYAHLAKGIIAFSKDTWDKEEASFWTKNVRKVELNGQEFYITDAQLMYLYLVNKREQGIEHLDGQGFVVEEIPRQAVIKKNGNKSKSDLIKSTKDQRDEFFERYLPEGSRQREVADKMQRFLAEECALWGNEVSMVRWGFRAFTDPNYVPLYSDKRQLASRAPEATNFDLNRILNLGFTKSLNADAKNSLLIYDVFDVFAEHTSDMAKYHSLGLHFSRTERFLGFFHGCRGMVLYPHLGSLCLLRGQIGAGRIYRRD